MTDKKIIDGVDVSKCEYYAITSGVISNVGDCYISISSRTKKITGRFEPCECNPNCYYKQLSHKTAECDKYEQALDEIEEYCDKQISLTGDLPFRTTESDILDIISKAKEK